MKRRLFRWLFPSQKVNLNTIPFNFKTDSFRRALGFDANDFDKLEDIITTRCKDWMEEDQFEDIMKLSANFEAECIFRGVTMTAATYLFIGQTSMKVSEKRQELNNLERLKSMLNG